MTKDDFHEREPLNIIMRYKAERTTIAEAAAEIRAYASECVRRAAEPPADRKSALDEIVRISEEAGLYEPACAHSDMERVDGHICASCGGYRSLDEPDAPLRHLNRTPDHG